MADDDWDSAGFVAPASSWDAPNAEADAVDDWDAEPEPESTTTSKPAESTTTNTSKAAPQKKQPALSGKKAALLKMKEAEEAARKEAAAALARKKAIEEEERRRRTDPDYARKQKEKERAEIEASERELASDLFDFGPKQPVSKPSEGFDDNDDEAEEAPSSQTEVKKDDKVVRANQLANATGLGDGADAFMAVNTPSDKTEANKQNALSDADLSTKEKGIEVAKQIATRLNGLKNNAIVLAMLKELITKCAIELKLEEINEIVRVATVIKNEATKAVQNKKKKDKGKATIKHIGGGGGGAGAYDDDDDYYDDGY